MNEVYFEALDVSDAAAVRRTLDLAFAELGRIDVVINNAGYALFGAVEELNEEQIRRHKSAQQTQS